MLQHLQPTNNSSRSCLLGYSSDSVFLQLIDFNDGQQGTIIYIIGFQPITTMYSTYFCHILMLYIFHMLYSICFLSVDHALSSGRIAFSCASVPEIFEKVILSIVAR